MLPSVGILIELRLHSLIWILIARILANPCIWKLIQTDDVRALFAIHIQIPLLETLKQSEWCWNFSVACHDKKRRKHFDCLDNTQTCTHYTATDTQLASNFYANFFFDFSFTSTGYVGRVYVRVRVVYFLRVNLLCWHEQRTMNNKIPSAL